MMTYGRSERGAAKARKEYDRTGLVWSVPIQTHQTRSSCGKITKSRDGGRFTNR